MGIETSAPESFIVFLGDAPGSGGVEERAAALMRSLGITAEPTMVYDQLGGFVITITEQQAQRLRALRGVNSVEADAAVFLEPPILEQSFTSRRALDPITGNALSVYNNRSLPTGETIPWGIQAVWQRSDIDFSKLVTRATNKYAFVIDSGILTTTNDLNINSSWHYSWISGETPFTDGNGHGTHVAGTIGAQANGRGVVGVAPGAKMISLKVFDSSGGGASYSTIIAAIDYATSVIETNTLNTSDVVINMSLGGSFSSSLDTAVRKAANKGIAFSIAAGNSGQDADKYSPAAAGDDPNVFTVSAVDSNYRMPNWSNWDRIDRRDNVDDVDFAAPGVSVLSYYKNGQLAYLSGTSMAAPHVAGLLLMGGVTSGDFVTPFSSNTADPFAWGNTSIFS